MSEEEVLAVISNPNAVTGLGHPTTGDVVFVLDDGSHVRCHSRALNGEMREECAQRNVEFKDVDRASLQTIVDFLYGKPIILTQSNAENIYAVAIMFKIAPVMSACWTITMGTHVLVTILNSDLGKTPASTDALARVFELEPTQRKALRQSPDVIKSIITSPFLILNTEDDLCKFLLKYYATNKKQDALMLFHFVLAENLSSELCERIFAEEDKQIVKILAKRRFIGLEMHENTSNRYKKRSRIECFMDLLEILKIEPI